ncbi:hypothetical protein ENSA5_59910 [Enhygromyxa salina]|uniref:Rad50/SbcC-type AAA domain-containing protein n=1 Tax=Enhygromyxa salina TaxID=215803 RepID=A0A2S9XDH5_9BACT|nr:hypothetical protein [Enhygromyxa salina]PRP90916.1 hypothetical protein ENSA5_59910 [Enhygromyxa salina]
MYLERTRVVGLGPFETIEVDFCDRPGEPRLLTVIHGDGGTGKTSLLSAISATRPANHVVQTSIWRRPGTKPHALCEWRLGAEDPERPHPLKVATPGVTIEADDQLEQLRRREVVHFDRALAEKGGFAFVGIPGSRRFPRSTIVIGDPARTVLRVDTRGAPGFQDQNGVELTRPVKLILAYAGLSTALAGDRRGESGADPRCLGVVIQEALDELLGLIGYSYRGLSPRTFEPRFETPGGGILPFDALPIQARQLVSFATLPVHQMWVANRGADPRHCEGTVLIDDVDLNVSTSVQLELPATLRRVLPKVQWVLGTASPVLAHAAALGSTVTLRREPGSDRVEAYEGELSLTH